MSFVNLMASDVWSPMDIDAKVQALIRSRYSENDELKAARLARIDSADEFVAALDQWVSECVQEGRQARKDMKLLNEVLVLEVAHRRLLQPEVAPEQDDDGNITNADAVERDREEREAAQEVLNAATPEAMELFELRNPPVDDQNLNESSLPSTQPLPE